MDSDMDIAGAVNDDDELNWWELGGGPEQGILTSSILYTQDSPDWDAIDWNSSIPPGTSLFFQVRSSLDPGNMGPWSDSLYNPCSLEGILTDLETLVQYRVILETRRILSSHKPESLEEEIVKQLQEISETAEKELAGKQFAA